MTPERWRQVEEFYHAALDLPAGQRSAFLTQSCGSDEELRNKVAALLKAHSDAGDFLVHPAMEVAAQAAASKESASWIGRQISHYEILSLGRRRDGRGVQGPRYSPQPHGSGQSTPATGPGRPGAPGPIRTRSADDRRVESPAYLHAARRRTPRWNRLSRDGISRGRADRFFICMFSVFRREVLRYAASVASFV